jgi:hypothetical protein
MPVRDLDEDVSAGGIGANPPAVARSLRESRRIFGMAPILWSVSG